MILQKGPPVRASLHMGMLCASCFFSIPHMGIPCIRTLEKCKNPLPPFLRPVWSRHNVPQVPRKHAFTWDSMSSLHDFAESPAHMESPYHGSHCISQFTWFSHVEGMFLVTVNMGIPCNIIKKCANSVQTAPDMGNPCKRMKVLQQHGITMLFTIPWAPTAYGCHVKRESSSPDM